MYQAKRSGIQLCYPLEERRLSNPKFGWTYPVITQPKLDGERCRAVEELPGQINLISSELNDFMSVPHINQALEAIKKSYPSLPELDGELFAEGLTFPEIHSIVSRSLDNLHPDFLKIHLNVFDYVSDQPQIERTLFLTEIFDKHFLPSLPVKLIPSKLANNFSEIMDQYKGYRADGYEGIIVRHINAPYVRKRSRFVLKFKPKKTDTYTIVGSTEAIDKSGYGKNMIGSLTCVGNDGTEFSVGAGELSHFQRHNYWEHREKLIGRQCLISYQNIISASGKPRFGLCKEIY